MDGDKNPFLDQNWRTQNRSPSPLIDFNECGDYDGYDDVGRETDEEARLGAVGGAPRANRIPTIEDGDRFSDFQPGGSLSNMQGRVLFGKDDEIAVLAENRRLRQQATTEHNRMLAAQEEAKKVTSEVCRRNDELRDMLFKLGIDPDNPNMKSTPSGNTHANDARKVLKFPERSGNGPKLPPRVPQQSQGPHSQQNQNRENVNAFTDSGGTQYKDLPPPRQPNPNYQGGGGRGNGSSNNNRLNNRFNYDQCRHSPLRIRNSEEIGGPQFSSTQRNSDGQPRGRGRGPVSYTHLTLPTIYSV